MKGKVLFASEIEGRINITTDATFKVCDRQGVENDGNAFSLGQKSILQALLKTPFGAMLMAKCAGNPTAYEGVTNVIVYLLCNAEITFERTKLLKGQKRMDGKEAEFDCYQTKLMDIAPANTDMAIFMQLLPMITKKQATQVAVNPFM